MAFQPAAGLTNLSALLRRRGGRPLMVPVSPSRLEGGWHTTSAAFVGCCCCRGVEGILVRVDVRVVVGREACARGISRLAA